VIAAFAAAVALAAAAVPVAAQDAFPLRQCGERIESGRAPLSFPVAGPGTVVVGPVAFAGLPLAGLGTRLPDGRYSRKVGLLVRAGRPVVISVPERYRDRLWLQYIWNEDTSAARIEPCPPSTRAFSYAGRVGAVTGFSGGFLIAKRGCYPLDVRVVGGRTHRVRIAFGYPCR
jgi:hypothetical protein